MVEGQDVGLDESRYSGNEETQDEAMGSCVVLVGGMGAGKTSVGWQLSRLIGFGYVDVDRTIELKEKKAITTIFESRGEPYFRALEKAEIEKLQNLRSHVVSVGGGALMDASNWDILNRIGATVWLNPPAGEIARRMLADVTQLKTRPLLADVLELPTPQERIKTLTERLTAIVGMRSDGYRKARLTVADTFSTPESTARLVRDLLVREGILKLPEGHRPFDRWGVM